MWLWSLYRQDRWTSRTFDGKVDGWTHTRSGQAGDHEQFLTKEAFGMPTIGGSVAITNNRGIAVPCCITDTSHAQWDTHNIYNLKTLDDVNKSYHWFQMEDQMEDEIWPQECTQCKMLEHNKRHHEGRTTSIHTWKNQSSTNKTEDSSTSSHLTRLSLQSIVSIMSTWYLISLGSDGCFRTSSIRQGSLQRLR